MSIAAINGRRNIVISGAEVAVQAVCEVLEAAGVRTQRLNVSHAFHSPLMDPILDEFEATAAGIQYAEPKLRFISNLTGYAVESGELDARYWRQHIRQPVLFARGLQSTAELGLDVFVETGPNPTLCAFGRQTLSDTALGWLPSLRQGKNGWQQILESLSELYVRGAEVDWAGFDRDYPRRRCPLPTYPLQGESYWIGWPSPLARSNHGAAGHFSKSVNPLAGKRLHTAGHERVFETTLQAQTPAFLNDHRILGKAVLPATGYWEIALAAAATLQPEASLGLSQVTLEEPLVLSDTEATTVQLVLSPHTVGGFAFEIHSLIPAAALDDAAAEMAWKRHASGRLSPVSTTEPMAPVALNDLRASCPEALPVEPLYEQMYEHGMEYGPGFQAIHKLWRGDRQSLARVELSDQLAPDADDYCLHPALLDACLQVLGANLPEADEQTLYLPVGLERLDVYRRSPRAVWCHAMLQDQSTSQPDTERGVLHLLDDNGQMIAVLQQVQLRRVRRQTVMRLLRDEDANWLYEMKWHRIDLPTVAAPPSAGRWLILADAHGVGDELAAELAAKGETATLVRAGQHYDAPAEGEFGINPLEPADFDRLFNAISSQEGPPFRGVVHLWSLDTAPSDATSFDSLRADQQLACGSILHLVQHLPGLQAGKPRLWFVTRGVHLVDSEPAPVNSVQSLTWGLGRVVTREYPDTHGTLIDLDPAAVERQAAELLDELWTSDTEDQVAYRHGERYAARLVRSTSTATESGLSIPDGRPYQLQISARGVLDNLTLAAVSSLEPGPGEVKIAIRATGLNFRDVLNALGMYPGDPGPLGGECAGDVVAVGDGVTRFAVGQSVVAIAPGCFSSEVVVPAELVATMPDAITYAQATTLPITFLTAHYALNDLGKMTAGDKVLIHAASGGVGLAAIQLAQRVGAEIFATAGNPKKRDFLRTLGIQHVMDSRTLDFADEIRSITNGQGVDIILNSLAGEFITQGLSILAPGGRFLEIGKIDVWDDARIAEHYSHVVYQTIALDSLAAEQPHVVAGLLQGLMDDITAGTLQPLPLHAFPMTQAVDAFRLMQRAQHIGKVVITRAEPSPTPSVQADSTYLITGGTGALGMLVARHFVEQGARALAIMGRRELSETARQDVAAMEQLGAQLLVIRGDVSEPADVAEALSTIERTMPPLRGIIHAAGVLDDGVLANQDLTRFRQVLRPKVDGAWNLHAATRDLPLDFFVLFSSAAAVMGAPGQGNYAAANSFLDALAHERQGQGLPGLSLNWGAWADAGMAARSQEAQRSLSSRGIDLISPPDGLELLNQLLRGASAQLVVVPIQWNVFREQFPPGVDLPLLRELTKTSPRAAEQAASPDIRDAFLAEFQQTPEANRLQLVLDLVTEQTIRVLGLDPSVRIDPRQTLNELGLDSLMAVELCNALGGSIGRTLQATILFDYPTTQSLAEYLNTTFAEASGAPEAQMADVAAVADDPEWSALEQLPVRRHLDTDPSS